MSDAPGDEPLPEIPEERRAAMRREAERRVGDQSVEELRIYQVELEMQHHELQSTLGRLEGALERFRVLFDDAPMALFELDDGARLVRANRRALSLFAIEKGDSFHTLAPLGRVSAVDTLIHGRTRRGVTTLRSREGELTVRMSVEAISGGLMVALEDISGERAAQLRLERSERQLRQLWDMSPDAIAVLHSGRIVFGNPALARLLAMPRHTLVGTVLNDHLAEPIEPLRGVGDDGSVEASITDIRGGVHPIEVRRAEVEVEGRAGELWSIRDLSARRRLEASLARSERLATIGMLVAGVAHEINNPLAFVLSNLDLLRTKLSGDEELSASWRAELAEAADDAHGGAERLASIVADLRTFQQSEDALVRVDVNELVSSTLRLAEPKLAHRAKVRRELGILRPIAANEGRLAQVILNLVLNAAAAMPEERPVAENLVRVRTYLHDGHACIAVDDNGKGMHEEELNRIYDPFYTTRKTEVGTGLGLAICDGIVQQLGGYMTVESTPGEGTTFVVHIPCDGPVSERAPERPVSEPNRPIRILVVDDEPPVARALRRVLAKYGRVELVHSGNEAIAHLSEGAPEYDVILSDLVMADGSGRELLEWLTTHRPLLVRRLVFISGMAHPGDVLPAGNQVPHLGKPFDNEELRRMVFRVAARGSSGE